ncbi:MAG: hypothetical protein LC687_05210 [Actinobacteria bacterium]|nr:hypothetical protein [Actinomycetota bacterium]
MTGIHNWVKHTVTQVSVISDPDEDDAVIAVSSPEQVEEAEEKAVFGCSRCGLPLNPDTSEVPCGGHNGE